MPFSRFRRAGALLCLAVAALVSACEHPADSPEEIVPEVTLAGKGLAAGEMHVCSLSSEGQALCWGNAVYGATGHAFSAVDSCIENLPAGPQTACSLSPRPVGDGSHRFASLSVGNRTSCGIQADGTALCWGLAAGVLGQPGSTVCWPDKPCNLNPVPVAGGTRWKQLSIGGGDTFHACGVSDSGEGFCWGRDAWGRLGTGTVNDPVLYEQPRLVAGGLRFQKISAGTSHTCGLTPQGAAYCWGSNYDAQLGTNQAMDTCTTYGGGRTPVQIDFACTATPVAVQGGRTFTDLQVNASATCGLTAGGELYCWGGFDGAAVGTPQPRRVFAGIEIASFALAQVMASPEDYLCVVAKDGAAYCWAGTSPSRGETGDGAQRYQGTEPAPARVAGTARYTRIAVTQASACGATTDGGVNCWGWNFHGAVGRPELKGAVVSTPVQVAHLPR